MERVNTTQTVSAELVLLLAKISLVFLRRKIVLHLMCYCLFDVSEFNPKVKTALVTV